MIIRDTVVRAVSDNALSQVNQTHKLADHELDEVNGGFMFMVGAAAAGTGRAINYIAPRYPWVY